MKIFVSDSNTCVFNYQDMFIRDALNTLVLEDNSFALVKSPRKADSIVIPTACACTGRAITRSNNYIHKILKVKKPGAKVYLSGCITNEFTKPELKHITEDFKRDDIVIIPHNSPERVLQELTNGSEDYSNGVEFKEVFGEDYQGMLAAKIYINTGCLNKCSFCKTTYQNRPIHSVDPSEVKDAIDMMAEKGFKFFRLCGTNVSQYGLDLANDYLLPEILEYLEGKEDVFAYDLIGFGFKDAIRGHFDDILANSIKVSKVSGGLESLSNDILKLMNKGYTREEVLEFINHISNNTRALFAVSIIAGFPTETMEDIKRTVEGIASVGPQSIMVDIYRYINSSFVDSNNYEQLSPREIRKRGKIYEKELKRNGINAKIVV